MTPRKQFIISMIVMLMAGTMFHLTRPVNPDPYMRRGWFWANKTHDTSDKTLILYGDSRMGQAVSPELLRDVFPGKEPLNKGYDGAGFNKKMYGHLKRIAKGKEDEMVFILGFTPYSLTTESMNNEHFLEEWNRSESEVRIRLQLYPLLSIFEPIAPSCYYKAENAEGHYSTYHADGWQEAYEIPENPSKWLEAFERHFRRTQVDQVNIDATVDFLQYCKKHEIPVFGFRPPTTREMEEVEEASGFDEDAFIETFEAAGGKWIRFEDRFAYFSYDGSHLDYRQAKQFSRDLAAAIEDLL